MNIIEKISDELKVKPKQVEAAIGLLDDGATVPFISRYRKEATDGLDDTQLRNLAERLIYLRELIARKHTILDSIQSQDKLTAELKKSIEQTDSKSRLEDLYLPYKPKRRTKAQIAREAGLEPLADKLFSHPDSDPSLEAKNYLNDDIADEAAALEGARAILAERFSENADLLESLRNHVWRYAKVISKVAKGKEQEGVKFSDYFDFNEAIHKIPSHRALAMFRGRKEKILHLSLEFDEAENEMFCIEQVAKKFNVSLNNNWLSETIIWTWKFKLKLTINLDLMLKLREKSELDAITVFNNNLKNLLMAAPAGHKVTLGLDPGLRTGVKAVVVDHTGKLLEFTTIFPHVPRNDWDKSIEILAKLCKKHSVNLVAIGNGTGSRESDRLMIDVNKRYPDLKLTKVIVSEAGASVYSASQLAADEFPDLDVSYRGAVSIARRLQDPLAELIKIDPKAIGVGQYQHDVNQTKLGQGLNYVMEDCVNAVGADVNTASVPLLKSIAGLNSTIAKNIVTYREANGQFSNRAAIKKVPALGDKTYEQAIGFLRISNGDNPLDASAVHPESYPVVNAVIKQTNKTIKDIMGNIEQINQLNPADFVTDTFGLPTVQDIFAELKKPGRDPRPEFETATFGEGIETIKDLIPDMKLEGVITNVTNFGAFVDIGVHQDGLVHISLLSDNFVSDPHKVVKVGQVVNVKVVEIDAARKRIALSMKLQDGKSKSANTKTTQTQQSPNKNSDSKEKSKSKPKSKSMSKKQSKPPKNTGLADALFDALK